ncbi:MAG TPA: ATP-binding protein [Pyrinomonadaceae bacterium]|jgi:SpoVK/Ycf46/Vps4 family AAA+-type ATPase
MAQPAYANSNEHLRDELRRLDYLLCQAVAEFRARQGEDYAAEFRGLCISEEEIDELLDASSPAPGSNRIETYARLASLGAEIQERTARSLEAGVALRLPHLSRVFALSPFEKDVLLLALAPELDLRYQKLYAYLQDDVLRKRPSVDLALRLLCVTSDERIAARQCFAASSPLLSRSLVTLHEDASERPVPLLGQSLKVDERIVEFCCGSDRFDARLSAVSPRARFVAPRHALRDLQLPQKTLSALERLVEKHRHVDASSRPLSNSFSNSFSSSFYCLLYGARGAGKKTCAEAVSRALGYAVLTLDLRASLAGGGAHFQTALRLAVREAMLYGAAAYLDGWLEETGDEARRLGLLEILERELEDFNAPVFFGSRSAWEPPRAVGRRFVSLEVALPGECERQKIWQTRLDALANTRGKAKADGETAPHADEIDASYLASAFRFNAGQIERALSSAATRAWLRGDEGEEPIVTMEDVLAGCRAVASQQIVSFAKKIEPRRKWSELVLPKDTLAQLAEFCQQARHRVRVYDLWGFGERLSLGKGLIALFTGQSGTGKTLSAEVLAGELGLDLYRVDLSAVVSKYIGETEKNLSRVFDDAQQSSAILFFDEADALFGKRSEVKDAHDRYANIEVNYLLQRVEEYEGVIILASNMSKNIDEAFLRRMHYSIEFPFPDETSRLRIWRGLFPAQAPVASDIEFDFLARKFKIAGGNIKNVALSAAFFAAADGGVINMEHVVLALRREYQKLGRVCEKQDFEKYYSLVR